MNHQYMENIEEFNSYNKKIPSATKYKCMLAFENFAGIKTISNHCLIGMHMHMKQVYIQEKFEYIETLFQKIQAHYLIDKSIPITPFNASYENMNKSKEQYLKSGIFNTYYYAVEELLFHIRQNFDLLIQVISNIYQYSIGNHTIKSIKCDSIGMFINNTNIQQMLELESQSKIIIFLKELNEITNCLKHGHFQHEAFNTILFSKYPCFSIINIKNKEVNDDCLKTSIYLHEIMINYQNYFEEILNKLQSFCDKKWPNFTI